MLFDLRARGRRRTVRIVYLGLAILFGFSFIFIGVGTGGSFGGLAEGLFGSKEGSNGAGFGTQVASAEKRTKEHPNEAAAWAALLEAQYHEAGAGGEFYEESTGKFTAKGKAELAKAANSWSRYLALNPSKVNLTAAQYMVGAFSQEGLNQPSSVVEALQFMIAGRPPSAALYGELAEYAYLAKNTREGDLASQKAISLTPASQRPKVEAELKRIKQNPTGAASGESSGATTTTTVPTTGTASGKTSSTSTDVKRSGIVHVSTSGTTATLTVHPKK
jgi:hypothetical protein